MSIFSQNKPTKLKGNTFDLSHDRKLSTVMGRLTPVMVMDCIPGDRVHIKPSVMVRFAPMIAPPMHQVSVYCHYFFVPHRIVWSNFEEFISPSGNGQPPYPAAPYIAPEIIENQNGSLSDYLGLPTVSDQISLGIPNIEVSALPYASYQAIYNEYYRDQNLIPEVNYQLSNGNNLAIQSSLETIRKRAWQHDYFTSALPWTQRGPEATVPLGTRADIVFDDDFAGTGQRTRKDDPGTSHPPQDYESFYSTDAGGDVGRTRGVEEGTTNESFYNIDLMGTHYTDLSSATASSITDLRRAFKLQEWLEKSARGGSRYIEQIKSFFGVHSSDKRLQRPEYIGGFSSPVKISEVLNTTGTQDSPQGNMAGHGVSIGGYSNKPYFCEEHGYIIGIMSIMPKSAYEQGIPRHFFRFDKFDYYWPQFAHIGEQGIYNKEVCLNDGDNDEIFGYVPRYSEYKFINSSVHGDFRGSLDFWHMGRRFANMPALNQDFIEMDDNEVSRIFAVEEGSDSIWCHVYNKVKARRLMPYFGEPKM